MSSSRAGNSNTTIPIRILAFDTRQFSTPYATTFAADIEQTVLDPLPSHIRGKRLSHQLTNNRGTYGYPYGRFIKSPCPDDPAVMSAFPIPGSQLGGNKLLRIQPYLPGKVSHIMRMAKTRAQSKVTSQAALLVAGAHSPKGKTQQPVRFHNRTNAYIHSEALPGQNRGKP